MIHCVKWHQSIMNPDEYRWTYEHISVSLRTMGWSLREELVGSVVKFERKQFRGAKRITMLTSLLNSVQHNHMVGATHAHSATHWEFWSNAGYQIDGRTSKALKLSLQITSGSFSISHAHIHSFIQSPFFSCSLRLTCWLSGFVA